MGVRRRRHPVRWLQFNLGTLDDFPDGSAEGLDGADFAIHVECDRLVIADEGHEAQHQCHQHHELRANLDEAELAVRCEELDHDCPNLLDLPGTGISARSPATSAPRAAPDQVRNVAEDASTASLKTRARMWFVCHDARPASVKLSVGLPRPRLIVDHCNRSVIKEPRICAYPVSMPGGWMGAVQSQDPY